MTLKQMHYAISVSRHGSFTRAARENGTVQPNISRQIQYLERELGFEIFVRDRRNVRTTDPGRIILSCFSQMLGLLDEAREKSLLEDGVMPAPRGGVFQAATIQT